MTVTFRDLYLRRERRARDARFKLAHLRNVQEWQRNEIEWLQIDTGGLTDRMFFDMAQQSTRPKLAKRNRLQALEF